MLTTQTGGGSQMSGTVAVGGRSLKSIDNSDDDVFVGFWVLGNQNNYGPNCTTARNTFVGSRIAFSHESEEMEDNVIIGYGASADAGTVVVKNLFDNVIIGSVAGRQFGGQKNIIIGSQAAWNASELQDSVILTPHSSNARPFLQLQQVVFLLVQVLVVVLQQMTFLMMFILEILQVKT